MNILNIKSTSRETTTPLDLSVRRLSPISNPRDRSLSISSAISGEHLRMDFDQLLENSKENRSISGDSSVTPEQIVCAPSLPGSPPLTPSPKRRSNSPRGSNASLSPSSMHHLQLPMKSLMPAAELALRLSESGYHNLNQIPQLLTKHDVELALRISSASSNSDGSPKQISPLTNQHHSSPSPNTPNLGMSPAISSSLPPQIFVKQGVSKCKECNIVFCKYENYLAHKKHYCSARNVDDPEATKTSPPVSPQSKSPSGALSYQQLICAACGIKFTSLDNLSAHQMYYCPKRLEIQVHLPVKERCGKCKTIHETGTPCTVVGPGTYKCPICDVVSVNSAEARRHMETHAGVKAFRCSICSYKGNTLR
jgi:zinc finger protein ZFPM1